MISDLEDFGFECSLKPALGESENVCRISKGASTLAQSGQISISSYFDHRYQPYRRGFCRDSLQFFHLQDMCEIGGNGLEVYDGV